MCVWNDVSLGGHTDFHVFPSWTKKAHIYSEDILNPYISNMPAQQVIVSCYRMKTLAAQGSHCRRLFQHQKCSAWNDQLDCRSLIDLKDHIQHALAALGSLSLLLVPLLRSLPSLFYKGSGSSIQVIVLLT